ncbi:DUF6517 family protein [Natronomonas salsuginis]|jgi:hypothetical protein|uniref:Uncharacterized protein n=1 Tax=Natronomonas salsuginis TaxID=2217661 RepID=A0A4U5JNA3_9EURY|nr:DUF6517 family protein [Natronomonas salsuginis]TKR27659.1 hypothetical protein DM868_00780 [Natronomonas salsuginis]
MRRRALLAGAGGLTVSALSGCLGTAGLDEYEATPAGVDPAVREETGYEQTDVRDLVVRETVGFGGVSEEIVVTNYLTEHEKSISLGPFGSVRVAAFVLLTSPQISIAGQAFNPIAEMSTRELVDLLEADFEGINNVEHVSDGEVRILDQETVESIFEGKAQVNGTTVDVNIHITESVQTTNDHLITVGVYPTQVGSSEEENVRALMGGVVERTD